MQSPTMKMDEIDRLLSAFPPASNAADPEQALRNYLLAVDDYPADDVAEAVDAFLKSRVPGFDGRFAPTAPMVAAACRKVMEVRLDQEHRLRDRQPRLPPPDIPKPTDEQRARAAELVRQFEARVAANNLTEDAEATRRKTERWQRTNARFMPDMDPDALAERLGIDKPRWSSGDPDGEEYAA